MMPQRVLSLPPVPPSFEDPHGHPRFGTFRGELDEVVLSRLRGPYSLPLPFRLLKHKKWTYVQVVTAELVAVFAIVDLTYTSSAFVSVLDLRSRRALYDDGFMGLPGTRVEVGDRPGSGLEASFRRPDVRFSLRRGAGTDSYRFEVETRPLSPFADRLSWHGELSCKAAPDALSVVSPVAGDGVVNVTQKRAALLSSGTLRVGRRTWSLDGGVGGIDYTNGFLARHTAWRWAMGNGRLPDGTAFGFNLVEGINDTSDACNENALWLGGELHPLPRATFEFQRQDPTAKWAVRTVDGSVDLSFRPLHLHHERRDLKLVKSNFLQPLGLFSGTLGMRGRGLEVKDVGGVTEDQDILW